MPPVLVLIGKPNCGKTTLIEKLIPAFVDKGHKGHCKLCYTDCPNTIKHSHSTNLIPVVKLQSWHLKTKYRSDFRTTYFLFRTLSFCPC